MTQLIFISFINMLCLAQFRVSWVSWIRSVIYADRTVISLISHNTAYIVALTEKHPFPSIIIFFAKNLLNKRLHFGVFCNRVALN